MSSLSRSKSCLLFGALSLPITAAPLAILEAESGARGANIDSFADGSASGADYAEILTDQIGTSPASADDIVRYMVDLDAGEYNLYARINVGPDSANDDSFFIGNGFGEKTPGVDTDWVVIDDLSMAEDVSGTMVETARYVWVNLGSTLTYTSSGGVLVFEVAGRETGLRLDSFVFASTASNLTNLQLNALFDDDTDDDGLVDGAEISGSDNEGRLSGFGPTSPTNADSDDDNFNDAAELRFRSDPNDAAALPGTQIPFVNGSFEDPVIPAGTAAVAVSGGTVTGWVSQTNDMYITSGFPAGTPESPEAPAMGNGNQFATADRTAPDPDVEFSALEGGDRARMSIQQDIDLTSFADLIDTGDQTLHLEYDFYNDTNFITGPDGADTVLVTVSFLDAAGEEIEAGRFLAFGLAGLSEWRNASGEFFPPTNARTARVTVSNSVGFGAGDRRNVHVDNFRATLGVIDSDMDGLPDGWERLNGLNPDDEDDAILDLDGDNLSNIEEFQNRTNANDADSDGDGVNDGSEVMAGTDPLDNESFPPFEAVSLAFNAMDQLEITFEGLDPNSTYVLRRGTDLMSFSDAVETRQPTATTATYTDPSPPTGRAFYRLTVMP